jgi:urease accessory protein
VVAAAVGDAAAALAAHDPGLLPTDGSPLTDVLAQLHHRSEATLFAS